ncbi:SDR family NAD(P)-dependent oxidoreductase [Novosphingobium sp. FGD1]|uniref:SDR family NAD(P)-dependent oxidoreductase n=1 Tax=Novosphingobium silvae TaxID=2692619 RepID=A0A7X4GJE5_9SPHN|nr:SDR family NAD(P)-dependent oxidoreductase [Novosphingobium silvae]MYL99748.1 SDR family NAD(P)-dependent oxidoreductase [Novosphingobium silvae]
MPGFSFDLTGRTALVTGASSGIGRRFARLLASSGARVVATARRASLLDELCAEIRSDGGEALGVVMDVADEASTVAAFDAAEAAFGLVDTVVVNAGISPAGSALGLAVEDFDATMAINLRGAFLSAREGARRMVAGAPAEAGRGRVVLIGSITGNHTFPGIVSYGASKAAVAQMGRLLAKDWAGKGINVNTIAPGYMATEMTSGLWDIEKGQKLLKGFARQRLMGIDALDPILLYLCSDASAPVTGGLFTIDDGQTL